MFKQSLFQSFMFTNAKILVKYFLLIELIFFWANFVETHSKIWLETVILGFKDQMNEPISVPLRLYVYHPIPPPFLGHWSL